MHTNLCLLAILFFGFQLALTGNDYRHYSSEITKECYTEGNGFNTLVFDRLYYPGNINSGKKLASTRSVYVRADNSDPYPASTDSSQTINVTKTQEVVLTISANYARKPSYPNENEDKVIVTIGNIVNESLLPLEEKQLVITLTQGNSYTLKVKAIGDSVSGVASLSYEDNSAENVNNDY